MFSRRRFVWFENTVQNVSISKWTWHTSCGTHPHLDRAFDLVVFEVVCPYLTTSATVAVRDAPLLGKDRVQRRRISCGKTKVLTCRSSPVHGCGTRKFHCDEPICGGVGRASSTTSTRRLPVSAELVEALEGRPSSSRRR